MGGKNETTICGLRFHESGGKVHVHNDSRTVKFETDSQNFKDELKDAFHHLKDTEGIFKIRGTTKTDLCICKEGSSFEAFLLDGKSEKKSLQTFAGSL